MKPHSIDDFWELVKIEHHAADRAVPWLDRAWYRWALCWRLRRASRRGMRMPLHTTPPSASQRSLFEPTATPQETFRNHAPLAAKNDSESSHFAAAEITASGRRTSQKRQILEALRAKTGPCTSMELALGLDRYGRSAPVAGSRARRTGSARADTRVLHHRPSRDYLASKGSSMKQDTAQCPCGQPTVAARGDGGRQ
jgi:hypothetical protein